MTDTANDCQISDFRMFVLKQPRCLCQEGGWMCDRCDRIVRKHDEIVKALNARILDMSWEISPDRMGS